MDSLNNSVSKVTLRPIAISDTSNVVRWRNEDFVRLNLYSREKITEDSHLSYYRDYIETGRCHQFIISIIDDGIEHDIGTTFLKNIDSKTRKAEFGIFIGEKSALGKHLGTDAVKLVLAEAFNHLKMNKVYLSVFADNTRAISAYKNAGFIIEGCFKEDFFDGDSYHDIVYMAILRNEWLQSNSH